MGLWQPDYSEVLNQILKGSLSRQNPTEETADSWIKFEDRSNKNKCKWDLDQSMEEK